VGRPDPVDPVDLGDLGDRLRLRLDTLVPA
jgi:hypothetical protein